MVSSWALFLLATSSGVAKTMLAERRWAIPGGPGGFLPTMRGLTNDGDALVLATAETWVSEMVDLLPLSV